MVDIVKLPDKEFKAAIINMFKDIKENMNTVIEQMVVQSRNGNMKKKEKTKWTF